ncbi:MAG: ankyrin repeat domain-containing protein [Parachlamydiales bacterium]|nr:ankyrin repeat domain-containing protein [Parachlamydiales bacterium]
MQALHSFSNFTSNTVVKDVSEKQSKPESVFLSTNTIVSSNPAHTKSLCDKKFAKLDTRQEITNYDSWSKFIEAIGLTTPSSEQTPKVVEHPFKTHFNDLMQLFMKLAAWGYCDEPLHNATWTQLVSALKRTSFKIIYLVGNNPKITSLKLKMMSLSELNGYYDYQTPLFIAGAKRDWELYKELKKEGAKFDSFLMPRNSLNVYDYLNEQEINSIDDKMCHGPMICSIPSCYIKSAERTVIDSFIHFFSANLPLKEFHTFKGQNLIHCLLVANPPLLDMKLIIEILTIHGININERDDFGLTPIHTACLLGSSIEVIQLLLEHGADIKQLNNEKSVISYAIEAHRTEASKYSINPKKIFSLNFDQSGLINFLVSKNAPISKLDVEEGKRKKFKDS